MLLKRVEEYLYNSCSFKKGQKVLVALSGGADSMMLVNTLNKLGVQVYAAHCNFNLRGIESDGDEEFVRSKMQKLNVKLFIKSFQTAQHASKNGISIEMAARELRYAWFDELLKINNLNYIATGHHKDDSVETFFLNLIRGTGIKGLTGIKPATENLIRPLLCLTRKEIEEFCESEKIDFRTDSSNLESEFTRNKIRNIILPLFAEINPSFNNTMEENIKRIKQVSDYFTASVEHITEELVVEQDDKLLISLKHVNSFIDTELVLFEILHPYGFNGAVVNEIANTIKQEVSGKQFFSDNYRLIKDRHNLILLPKEEEHLKHVFYIDENEVSIKMPLKVVIEDNLNANDYEIVKNSLVAQFDSDLIQFPLTIRKWKQGDMFKPLGMKNFKKLSDFFIDKKFSIKDKEDAWLLLSGADIIWVIGHRTDDRYKITPKTKRVIKFTLLND